VTRATYLYNVCFSYDIRFTLLCRVIPNERTTLYTDRSGKRNSIRHEGKPIPVRRFQLEDVGHTYTDGVGHLRTYDSIVVMKSKRKRVSKSFIFGTRPLLSVRRRRTGLTRTGSGKTLSEFVVFSKKKKVYEAWLLNNDTFTRKTFY